MDPREMGSKEGDYSSVILELILNAFSPEELEWFCRDHPPFKRVLYYVPVKSSLMEMAHELIGYCIRQELLGELLLGIDEYNPRRFARYRDQFVALGLIPPITVPHPIPPQPQGDPGRKETQKPLEDKSKAAEVGQTPSVQIGQWTEQLRLGFDSLTSELEERWLMLCVLPMTFDRAAAEVVWNLGARETEKSLADLVEHDLLKSTRAAQRYSLPDLARQLAAQRMSKDQWLHLEANVVGALQDLSCRSQRAIIAAQCLLNVERLGGTSTQLRPEVIDALSENVNHQSMPSEMTSDAMLACLEIISRYIGTPDGRAYLIERIETVLRSGPPDRQRAQLVVCCGALLGQEEEIAKAETAYREAERLIENLRQTEDCQPQDLHLLARTRLGLANITAARGEELKGRKERKQAFRDAVELLLRARDDAEAYGQDIILQASINAELSYIYSLLREWPEAKASYEKALNALDQTQDPHAYVNYYAQILETASLIQWELGKSKKLAGDAAVALAEWQTAYRISQEEAYIVEKAIGESEALAYAHINSGDYLQAMSESDGCPVPDALAAACKEWQAAFTIADQLGLGVLKRQAARRIKKYCPADRT